MSAGNYFPLLASYNQWMNQKIYDCTSSLPAEALYLDRGAFFGSIWGTLNHIAVGDTIWLKRFSRHPACAAPLAALADTPTPQHLDDILFPEFATLRAYREQLDTRIIDLVGTLDEAALGYPLNYTNTQGASFTREFGALLVHYFNHQTHHRGQVTTLLFQAGVDPGVTDLLTLIPQTPAE